MRGLVFFGVPMLLVVVACAGDGSNSSTVTTSPGASATPTLGQSTPSFTPTPTPSATGTRYTNDKFGYSLELPDGWRVATQFMDAYGPLGAWPQGVGKSEDYAVLTSLSPAEESQFVLRAAAATPPYLTGIEPWLEFFLLSSIEIYPTDVSLSQQVTSATDGNVKHVVTDVVRTSVGGHLEGTRYRVELASDYGHFVYDTVFVTASVNGRPECTGFIIQTVAAGRSSQQSPGPVEPPPAAYPKGEFENVVATFQPAQLVSPITS
jgi:hypothetical protein